MGRWFARFFKEAGFRVLIYGRTPETARKVAKNLGVTLGSIDDAEDSDIVMVSVPAAATPDTCLKLGEKMKGGSALVEISAVKSDIEKLAEKIPLEVGFLSIHPLFGPSAKNLNKQDIVMVLNRESLWTKALRNHFEDRGARIIKMTSHEHDRCMACVQSLHHFALLSLGYAMSKCDPKFKNVSTRSLKPTLKTIKSMLKNLDTIEEIQSRNPYSKEARELFHKIVKEFAEEKPEEWLTKLRKMKN